jgi:hypothetical protein
MELLSKAIEGIKEPTLIMTALNRIHYNQFFNSAGNSNGVNIFEKDWDNLIILDACRFDAFQQIADLPGETTKVESIGSATPEFIARTFKNKSYYDTVYYTANGWYTKLKDEMGFGVHHHEFLPRDIYDGLSTHPETVRKAALQAVEKYPQKRLIAHFMQPHKPYLGPVSEEMTQVGDLHLTMAESKISDRRLKKAYDDTLKIVLEEVEQLLTELPGKTIVTADHGELLGERQFPIPVKRYGHYQGIYVPELVEVPWHTHFKGERRDIQEDKPNVPQESEQIKEAKELLHDLGYL